MSIHNMLPEYQHSDYQRDDVVNIDVGGKVYRSAISTLSSNSTYFRSLFSTVWSKSREGHRGGSGEYNNTIFVDQDPEPFAVLLSFMRLGCVHVRDLSEKVLLQAEFFGIEKLVDAVKTLSYWNMFPEFAGTDGEAITKFTEEFQSIKNAVTSGALPRYLTKRNQGHKEYANLHIIDPNDGDFLDRNSYGDLVAVLFVPKHFVDLIDDMNSEESEPRRGANMLFNDTHQVCLRGVPNCPTFLDALNWLSKHGFSKMETEVDRRRDVSHSEVELSLVVDITFSREVRVIRPHDCQTYQMIIDESRFLANNYEEPKEYAVLVNISNDCGYVKADIGEQIPRSNSLSLDPQARSRISLVQSGRFHNMMNWLQKESYIQREPLFEKAYLTMLKKRYINGIIDCKGVLVFSRRSRKECNCAYLSST